MTHYTGDSLSNKRRGVDAERRVKKYLEEKGYHVMKSSGSFGLFDLIALDKETIKLIQVKTTKKEGKTYKAELKSMKQFINHPPNAVKELWVWSKGAGWITKVVEDE